MQDALLNAYLRLLHYLAFRVVTYSRLFSRGAR